MTDQQAPLRHLAIIMDGNGRWARHRMMPRAVGHRQGAKTVRRIVRACAEQGLEVLTLFAFSTENWGRPQDEVDSLMQLFMESLERETNPLQENNIRLRIMGERSGFSPALQDAIARAEAATSQNNGMILNVAANYGGRWDIIQAVQGWCQAHGGDVSSLTPEALSPFLATGELPEPDLLIRTGGEHRISNFMIWQMAYTEFYFTDVLWPDFDEPDLKAAFADFAQRQRRFGRVVESC